VTRVRTLLICLGLLAVAFGTARIAWVPVSAPAIAARAGGVAILDLEPRWGADAVYGAVDGYGSDGRTAYLVELATVDIALPVLLGLTLFVALRLVLPRVAPAGSGWHRQALLPVGPPWSTASRTTASR
jgi:hypothetical protein